MENVENYSTQTIEYVQKSCQSYFLQLVLSTCRIKIILYLLVLSNGGESPMPESCESVPLLQAMLQLEPMSLSLLTSSELDKRLASVILLVIKLATGLL